MEKKSPSIVMLTVLVVVTALVIPMLPGITAAEDNSNSISNEVQWCCSYIEEEKDNSHTLSIPSIDINSNFNI
jgi:hypothetical protein